MPSAWKLRDPKTTGLWFFSLPLFDWVFGCVLFDTNDLVWYLKQHSCVRTTACPLEIPLEGPDPTTVPPCSSCCDRGKSQSPLDSSVQRTWSSVSVMSTMLNQITCYKTSHQPPHPKLGVSFVLGIGAELSQRPWLGEYSTLPSRGISGLPGSPSMVALCLFLALSFWRQFPSIHGIGSV